MDNADRDLPTTTVPHAQLKAIGLIVLIGALLVAFAWYVMKARGVFEPTQALTLVADNSEGVVVGMDLTFSGFPIGRVRRIELGDDGKAHVHIDVPVRDAHWLRTTSVFTLERGVVGGVKLRAFTGLLDDPPMPDGARRDVLIGDATAGVPQLVATMQSLVENLGHLTMQGGALDQTLKHLETLSANLNGKQGAITGLLGAEGARQFVAAIERSNRLLSQADARLFAQGGLLDDAQRATRNTADAVADARALLGDARASLQKVDAMLVDARAVAANARAATDDLDALRGEVESSLRKVSALIDDINRKWPLARDRELKLP